MIALLLVVVVHDAVDVVGRPDGTRPNPIEAQFKWLAETVYPTGNMNQECLKAQAPGEGWRASTTPLPWLLAVRP